VAASVGQALALVFGFLGLFGAPLLIFVALFVYLGAAQEASLVQMKAALGGIPVQRAMITDYRALAPDDSLGTAVRHILEGFQQDFPVVQDDRVVGMLTRAKLLSALSESGVNASVGGVMQTEFETAEPGEMLEAVFLRLQSCDCHSLPVLRNGQLVGVITMENLGEFLMIQSALKGKTPRAPAPLPENAAQP
jgi:predicted transcriptional regulator